MVPQPNIIITGNQFLYVPDIMKLTSVTEAMARKDMQEIYDAKEIRRAKKTPYRISIITYCEERGLDLISSLTRLNIDYITKPAAK